ncbi:phage tail protein [Shewanella frigidimarina]|uniref:phage tail protein n=1 Tax=Shewanella frigidimarina TaxID=56812 RepID=UPI003D7A0E84
MSQFFTILTRSGAAALANGMALGQAVHITSFQVGDGGGAAYEPTLEQLKASTALVNPVYTGAINELKQDPENPARYYIEGVVPVNKGGWTVREVGWFLENGEMFAVTKFPPSYKSVPADGAATELPIRTYLAIGSDANVTLKIDPTVVLATREFVDNKTSRLAHKLYLNPVLHVCRGLAQREIVVFDQGQSATVTLDAAGLQIGDVVEIQKLNTLGRIDIIGTVNIDVSSGVSELNHWLPEGKTGTLVFEDVAANKLKYIGGF